MPPRLAMPVKSSYRRRLMPEPHTPTRPTAEPPGTIAGILLIVGAVLCFSCMDASAKWLGRAVGPVQTIAARYILSFLFVAVFFNPWSRPGLLRTRSWGRQCGRALCLVTATLSGWTALRFLPLTKLTAITFAAPLIIALLAGPLLGERIGPRRLVAVGVGFTGVLVVTRPFDGAVHWATLLAIVAALANAFYSLLTRQLAAHDPPETTMFYTGLVGSVIMLPAAPFAWTPPGSARVWLMMMALGVFGALSHWLLILAHRRAPASALAPFYYAQILGAVVLGIVVFDEFPDGWTMVGSAIVTASGLYLFYRERVRQKHPSADVAG